MYLIAIGWIYVALMMSVAEATNTNGTVLGAIFTFLLYGLLPTGLLMYILGTPARKRALRERQAHDAAQAATPPSAAGLEPDTGGQATADTVAAVRKEP